MHFQVFILQVYLHMHTLCIISNELLSVKVFSAEEVCPWRWLGHPSSKYGPSSACIFITLFLCFYIECGMFVHNTCVALRQVRHKHVSSQ